MIILDLVHNIALLVALTVGYEQIHTRLKRENPFFSLLAGLLFACVGLVGMMTPMVFALGVIYDGRSIVLSAAGYICGPAAAFIAASITAAYRIYLGGAGFLPGSSPLSNQPRSELFSFFFADETRPGSVL
ncbi:hypothetical protein B4O97_08130 [Marispirochaeta aestuarii]|uniref:Signal transduction histidine kinase 5TM receptor LytS transmembrane region domain-containing protein n=1 Tax=Marispirochaeta aestuarii TaxID=1963862 RepID=A0A1Y1RYG2_9SPIO|nr:LytS/YhcK type 5TM receptor domain-containing protein [Marispirochaeta aestuarii]ORC35603.1 hypothetical protein B4O97_08130 [Marispirochaeta aestuarii]